MHDETVDAHPHNGDRVLARGVKEFHHFSGLNPLEWLYRAN